MNDQIGVLAGDDDRAVGDRGRRRRTDTPPAAATVRCAAGVTPEGLERLRQAALQKKPWQFSTGPRTAEGKARSSRNGMIRQKGPLSISTIRAELASYRMLMKTMQESRSLVSAPADVDR